MSQYSFVAKLRKGMGLYVALPLLSGILIALQLVLPSVAFASSTQSSYSFGTSQALDRASVSVVRLVVSYAPSVGNIPLPQCTGLGVLVKSWTANGDADLNNWVLTDGSLVDPGTLSCSPNKPTQELSTIQVFANNTYTANTPGQSLLGTFTITENNGIHCQVSCNGGPALFAFHTPTAITLPFIDLAATDLTLSKSLELKDASISALQPSPAEGGQAQ